jgi:hypothetical protein
VAENVWRGRRREQLRRLEEAVAEARANQVELAGRLELFEKIAAAAGLELDAPAAPDVPASLLAAARDRSSTASVRLDVGGHELIAVVGGNRGDAREWWAAIQRLAARLPDAS